MPSFTQLVPGSQASSVGSKPWLRYLAAKGYAIPEGTGSIYHPVANYPGTETRGPSYAPPIHRAEDSDTAFSVDQAVSAIAGQAGRPSASAFLRSAFTK